MEKKKSRQLQTNGIQVSEKETKCPHKTITLKNMKSHHYEFEMLLDFIIFFFFCVKINPRQMPLYLFRRPLAHFISKWSMMRLARKTPSHSSEFNGFWSFDAFFFISFPSFFLSLSLIHTWFLLISGRCRWIARMCQCAFVVYTTLIHIGHVNV